MTDNKDEWPTHAEELSRKGLETLELWLERHTRGEASARDVFVASEVLYAVMSGLVKWDALDPILEVNKAYGEEV